MCFNIGVCNRFWLDVEPILAAKQFGGKPDDFRGFSCNAVYPGRDALIIREHDGHRQGAPAHWGLVPGWVKEPDLKKFSKPNNARDDTIAKALAERKGMFYAPMRNYRCILIGSAWCEWTGEIKGQKVANRLSVRDENLIAFAGLSTFRPDWPGLSCTMVTTAAEGLAATYHERIPVILRGENINRWLDPHEDPLELLSLLTCLPEEDFVAEVADPTAA